MDDRLLSVDDVAAYLGVKRDTVYKWIVRHGLPARKVGRLWKFRRSEVDQWFDEQPVRRSERGTRAWRRRTRR
ncbi:MAG: helix-turn-helix domain-containing protein [Phycisphaerae bacterium]|nr:helix-turn-helix domain-containing protein [Phycisphaerae bacterium]